MEESSSVSDSDSDSDSVSYSKSSMLTSSMRFRARNSPSLLTFIRTPPAICDFWPYFRKLQRSYKHTLNYKSNSFTFQTCKMIGLVGFIKSTTLNCRFDPAFKFFYTMCVCKISGAYENTAKNHILLEESV